MPRTTRRHLRTRYESAKSRPQERRSASTPGGIIELQMHYTANGQAGNGSHEDRHHVSQPSRRRARCARSTSSTCTMRLPARRGRRRSERPTSSFCRMRPCGDSSRTRICAARSGNTRSSCRTARRKPILAGAAIRLQLADLLHVQGAAAGAEGIEDRLDGVVRQLAGEQEQSRIRTSTCCGAIRRGKRCSTRGYC